MRTEKERLLTRAWNVVETIESFVFLGVLVIVSLEWIGRWIRGYKKRASTREAHNKKRYVGMLKHAGGHHFYIPSSCDPNGLAKKFNAMAGTHRIQHLFLLQNISCVTELLCKIGCD